MFCHLNSSNVQLWKHWIWKLCFILHPISFLYGTLGNFVCSSGSFARTVPLEMNANPNYLAEIRRKDGYHLSVEAIFIGPKQAFMLLLFSTLTVLSLSCWINQRMKITILLFSLLYEFSFFCPLSFLVWGLQSSFCYGHVCLFLHHCQLYINALMVTTRCLWSIIFAKFTIVDLKFYPISIAHAYWPLLWTCESVLVQISVLL